MRKFTLTLNSQLESMAELEKFVDKCSRECGADSMMHHDMLLVLTEAVSNSIKHGNRFNPQKQVVINANISNNSLNFKVCDEGEGFDPKKVADPTHHRNLAQANGRGVFIMRTLANSLNFCDNGRTVEIEFKR
ncbi:MAG: ATP-binding protein [Sphingobacteriales bacterium]|nr:ATP-binding protein [Sphingobacteriales bacterium]